MRCCQVGWAGVVLLGRGRATTTMAKSCHRAWLFIPEVSVGVLMRKAVGGSISCMSGKVASYFRA